MGPKVSVVIPSFNHEAFIGRAVDSALAACEADLEVIVVDDGSTDASRVRLQEIGDPRVKVHLQENQGAHAALNRCLELAGGDVIFILNSDDLFEPDRIRVLANRLAARPEAALAASWIRVIDARGEDLGVKRAWHNMPPWLPPTAGPFLSALGDPRLALLETNWISTTSNLAFPSWLVRKHGLRFAPLRYAHDWDFILGACRHGAVDLVEEPLVRYRVHGDNTIREGEAAGQGRMRFEALWVVARHARGILDSAADSAGDAGRLRDLFWRSAPTFGCDAILDQLLELRGNDADPPGAYDALLESDHPFRHAAVAVLQG